MHEEIRHGLHLYYCGHEACEASHSFGPAVRRHYLMHFILKGKGFYRVGKQSFALRSGEAFLIRPDEITYYEADQKDPWEYIWIAFDGAEAERLIRDHQAGENNLVFSFENRAAMLQYLEHFLSIFSLGMQTREESFGYFYLIWSLITKPDSNLSSFGEQTYLNQAKKYLRHHFTYPVKIEDLARYIGIDRTYLYRIFMKYEHCSPKEYLTSCRISASMDMMQNNIPNLNLTEIALSCGFHDSASFSRQFKKETGVAPGQWLKKFR